MLPSTQNYKEALMIGQDSFATLQEVEVQYNPKYPTEPWFCTGGLAIVFKIKVKGKAFALKCFYKEATERQERLALVTAYIKQNPSDYFVACSYLEDELWAETSQGGNAYPVVLMEWVEGKTLDNYLAEICKNNDTIALQNLYFEFCNLAWWLQQQPFAHGDLKHDNLIVTPQGKLKLIDYDGMFVPTLHGRKATEQGSPCYQHPQRDAHFFNAHLDDFSLLVLQITLLALKTQPSLFAQHYTGDGILLQDTHYPNFAQSPIKTTLWQLPHEKLPLLLSQLQSLLAASPRPHDLLPLLQQDHHWINWLICKANNQYTPEQIKLKKWVLSDKKVQKLFTVQVSRYSLREELIGKYKNNWEWNRLSGNIRLSWSERLLEKFQDRWNWWELSRNTNLYWNEILLGKFEDRWDWEVLSSNENLPWSESLIEKYKDRWGWGELSLSGNESLPWSESLLEKYKNRWDWEDLSWNEGLPWTESLLAKYKDRWDWKLLSLNKSLPWSEALLEKYQVRWDWERLTRNESLPWSDALLDKYIDEWSWGGLSRNKSLSWSESLLEKYLDKWDWKWLSLNKSLPWSESLLEKYRDRWDWEGLSNNEGLLWSMTILEKYKHKLVWKNNEPWGGGLSINKKVPSSIEMIEEYRDRWDWNKLVDNQSIYFKVFSPHLTDALIEEIMDEIVRQEKE